jgi:hypothetical protein
VRGNYGVSAERELCRIIRHLGSGIVSIYADNLSKAGWSWGCVSAIDSNGRTIFVADAHRDDGKRFVVHADDKLTAFVELESQLAVKGMTF